MTGVGREEASVVLLLGHHKGDLWVDGEALEGLFEGSVLFIQHHRELTMGDTVPVVNHPLWLNLCPRLVAPLLGLHSVVVHPLLCQADHGLSEARHALLLVPLLHHPACILAGKAVHGADHRRYGGLIAACSRRRVSDVDTKDHAGLFHARQAGPRRRRRLRARGMALLDFRQLKPLLVLQPQPLAVGLMYDLGNPPPYDGVQTPELGIHLHGDVGHIGGVGNVGPLVMGLLHLQVARGNALGGHPEDLVAGPLHVVVQRRPLLRQDDQKELAGVLVLALCPTCGNGHCCLDCVDPLR
mmetsp:Transcript_30612/g.86576  ORF Transcript_30612/g.86576 Transcript_30612/m.86576 type:complete len:298 (-) Transcript_30612:874-1767(-)